MSFNGNGRIWMYKANCLKFLYHASNYFNKKKKGGHVCSCFWGGAFAGYAGLILFPRILYDGLVVTGSCPGSYA